MRSIANVINHGIKFIESSQQKDGSFLSFTSSNKNNFNKAGEYHTVFMVSLILSCLNTLRSGDEKLLSRIKDKAANFLLLQKSEHWSFNYWARGSEQSKTMPYPDDLDDTSCALAALFGYKPEIIDGEVLAGVATVLTALEVKQGGPYKTWLVPPDSPKVWLDVDLVVNSNIGYFLSLQEIRLKNLLKLTETAVESKNYTSPYYPSVYPVIYFISRFYKGKKCKEIASFLLEKQKNDNWGNPLDTALAVSSLINLGFPREKLEKSLQYIINKQKNGVWEPFAFCLDPAVNGKKYYAGSSALTTAFCLEAIQKMSSGCVTENMYGSRGLASDKTAVKTHKTVLQKSKKIFSTLGAGLETQSLKVLKRTIKSDKNKEIVLLPHFFANSIEKKLNPRQQSLVVELGLANLFGWMAYTIYDDFLDEEGDARLLSVANVTMRESYNIFLNTLPQTWFPKFVHEIFNRIDGANAWEMEHCRTKDKGIASMLAHPAPDFKTLANLADRSLGHVLGPIGILCALGYKVDSVEVTKVLEAFRQYIAAKQIHDDMHDWVEDLSLGQINSASAALFLNIKNRTLVLKKDSDDIQFLQSIFWGKTVVSLCDRAFLHIATARKLFLSAGVSATFVDSILDPLHSSTEMTLNERNETKKFIAKYAHNN